MRRFLGIDTLAALPYRVSVCSRCCPRQTNVHVCIHYRSWLLGRRPHSVNTLFLHYGCLQGFDLFLCFNRNGVIDLWRGQGSRHRCRYLRRGNPFLRLGRVQYSDGWWYCCGCGVRNRGRPGRLVSTVAFLSLLHLCPRIFHALIYMFYAGVSHGYDNGLFSPDRSAASHTPHLSTSVTMRSRQNSYKL